MTKETEPTQDEDRPIGNIAMKRKFRRQIRRLFLYAFASVIVLAVVGCFYEIESPQFRGLAKNFLEKMYDRRIEVGEASFNFMGRVTLRDVKVYNPEGYNNDFLLTAPIIYFHMGMTGGETSAFRPTRIEVASPEFWFERPDDGQWNIKNLWVKKEAKAVLPTFQLPITVANATVHYSDSFAGSQGIALTFKDVDIDYAVLSDGNKIKTSLQTKNVRLPEGGFLDLTLNVTPATKNAVCEIKLTDATVKQLGPYYEFVRMLDIQEGRADVSHNMVFSDKGLKVQGTVEIKKPKMFHKSTGIQIKNVEPRIEYSLSYGDTIISFDTIAVHWGRSLVKATGAATKRNVYPKFNRLHFYSNSSFGEDISFLLSDPRFQASGPLTGECFFRSSAETSAVKPIGHYDVRLNLNKSRVTYGDIVNKPPDIDGALNLKGLSGKRPEVIALTLGKSQGIMTPVKNGWNLKTAVLHGSDPSAYVIPFQRYGALKIDGAAVLEASFLSDGTVRGKLDLTPIGLSVEPLLMKPAGMPSLLVIDGKFTPRGFQFNNTALAFGKTRIFLGGRWAPGDIGLDIRFSNLHWNDLMRVSPFLKNQGQKKTGIEGDATGSMSATSVQDGIETMIVLTMNLNLDQSSMRFPHIGKKTIGQRSGILLAGSFKNETLNIREGQIYLKDSRMNVTGDFSKHAFQLELSGKHTGLDGFRSFLAGGLWSDLSKLEVRGIGDINATVTSKKDSMKLTADINGYDAEFKLANIWKKPTGEVFRIQTHIEKDKASTKINRFEVVQGASNLVYQGSFFPGGKLEGKIRADLQVEPFLKNVPGLTDEKNGNRKTVDSLKMIAGNDGRATLFWDVSGTTTNPK